MVKSTNTNNSEKQSRPRIRLADSEDDLSDGTEPTNSPEQRTLSPINKSRAHSLSKKALTIY
jgi:hypothetical protein